MTGVTPGGVAAFLVAGSGVLAAILLLNLLLLLGSLGLLVFLATELLLFTSAGPVDSGDFQVTEDAPVARLPIGAEADIRLRIRFLGPRPRVVTLEDTRPSAVEVIAGSPTLTRVWHPDEELSLEYRIRTPQRGRQELGPLRATRSGFLGLWFEEVDLGPERPLFVTAANPALRSAPAGLALYTRVRGRLALRHRGYGSEFRSLRAYELSDDIRHVAWRRSTPEQLLVREFEQESRQDYLLVYDVSSAMTVGRPGGTALDRAAEAGAVVTGFVERSVEDRVGLLTYATGVRQFLRPGRGATHFRRVGDNLALLAPREGPFDLASVLEEARRRLRSSTHLLVFSTLSEPLGDLHAAHQRFLARGHHLYLFAAETAGFYPAPEEKAAAEIVGWAEDTEERRLDRRLALLHAEGVPTFRFDRRGATPKVVAAYGQIRAWGSVG